MRLAGANLSKDNADGEEMSELGHEHHGWDGNHNQGEGITYIKFDCPMCGTIMRKIETTDQEIREEIMEDWQEEHRKLHDDAEAARQAKNFVKYLKGRE